MVAANMAIIPRLLRIARIIHGEAERMRIGNCLFTVLCENIFHHHNLLLMVIPSSGED
jgi:hypothetical protein